MNKPRWRFVSKQADIIVLLALHFALLWWLASQDVVAVLAGGGGRGSYALLFAGVFFVGIRLAVFFLLPGVILSRVLFGVWVWRSGAGDERSGLDGRHSQNGQEVEARDEGNDSDR